MTPHACTHKGKAFILVCAQVLGLKTIKPYTPDFKTAFDHFCIHPGGKTVIEGVGSQARTLTIHFGLPLLPACTEHCSMLYMLHMKTTLPSAITVSTHRNEKQNTMCAQRASS